ncbi:hypothetical protein ACFE04_008457 [Oxalis oulophora]
MASDSSSSTKVVILLKHAGDAPILKQNKFKISGSEKFAKVIDFLCRQLHRETMFVFVHNSFSPNPDELVTDLYNIMGYTRLEAAIYFMTVFLLNFGFDGKLVVNYANTMAWG